MVVSPQQLPAPANNILADFIIELENVLSDLLEGVYLTGSIALNDYHPKKSDIDFIVLLNEIPHTGIINKIERIHVNIEIKYHNPKLNGYYLTPQGFKNETHFISFFGNKLSAEKPFEPDDILFFELKNASYTLYGKSAGELPIDLNLNEVLKRLHHNINNYWAAWIIKHSGISIGYLLLLIFPRLTEWGLLGVARQLYTLETGNIISKIEAGNYYLNRLPVAYKPIMLAAIATRKVNDLQLKPSFKRAKQTLACMAFIIACFNNRYQLQC